MRALTTALTALGVLLLAGCGGNPEASPPPTPSATASPSASPSAEPPEMPAYIPNSTSGAETFARHYVELLNHLQSTGDSTPTESVEVPACGSCASVREDVTALYDRGGKLQGGAWRVSQVLDANRSAPSTYVVSLVVRFGPQQVFDDENSSPTELRGGSLPLTMSLKFSPDGWRVQNWTRGR